MYLNYGHLRNNANDWEVENVKHVSWKIDWFIERFLNVLEHVNMGLLPSDFCCFKMQ